MSHVVNCTLTLLDCANLKGVFVPLCLALSQRLASRFAKFRYFSDLKPYHLRLASKLVYAC